MTRISLPFSGIDPEIPGEVYLCQVRPGISCGACCGLYNVADASRLTINDMLMRRTELFSRIDRTFESVLAFGEKIAALESGERPISDFHHCPYIGFMDSDPKSPGCLLHPMASGNNGLDLRGASYYGGMTCNMYFCPSCRELPVRFKKIIRSAADDWYSYGLMITESTVLSCFFENAENAAGKELFSDEENHDSHFNRAVREFLGLKIEWPSRKSRILANYFFNDKEGVLPEIKDGRGQNSRWYPVFKAFRSEFADSGELSKAEYVLDDLVSRLVSCK